jgi:hypothetical protein
MLVGKGSLEALEEASDAGDIGHTSTEEGIVAADKGIEIEEENDWALERVTRIVPFEYSVAAVVHAFDEIVLEFVAG